MSIRQLPEDVVAKIRSSSTIISLNGVVCGLLKNSLDAGATKINIFLDYIRGDCTVEDNGGGIVPGEFKEDGGLGKPHHTSKLPPRHDIHGRNGNFLTSLASLSLVSVTSHHHRHNSHNAVLIHHGTVMKRDTPALPRQRFETFDSGTRVSVHDLFGCMPVRVKHRAALFSDSPGIEKEWGRLVCEVVSLLLGWTSNVSISIKETRTQRELRLVPPDNADPVSRTSRLFTRASLADPGDAGSWIPVSASADGITIDGCISLHPVASRRAQMLSLGILPILNESGNNVLYDEINKVFSSSSFGIVEEEKENRNDEKKFLQGPQADEARPKARKGIERWPMFYLRILIERSAEIIDMDDLFDHSQRDLGGILNLLKAMSYGFLKKHLMRPRKMHISSNQSLFSTAAVPHRPRRALRRTSQLTSGGSVRRPPPHSTLGDPSYLRAGSPFDAWHRVKVGMSIAGGPGKAISKDMPNSAPHQVSNADQLIGDGDQPLDTPFRHTTPTTELESSCERGNQNEGWIVQATESSMPSDIWTTNIEGTIIKRASLPHRVGDSLDEQKNAEPSEWLQVGLAAWTNPVFEAVQPSLPRAHLDLDGTSCYFENRSNLHQCGGKENGAVLFEAGTMSLQSRISRAALDEAELISQVDRKFVLLKLPLGSIDPNWESKKSASASALVAVDQHAADERCQLEKLMADYFETDKSTGVLRPTVEALKRPLVFEVSKREGDLLEQYRYHFKAWGIVYQLYAPSAYRMKKPGDDVWKLSVTALPPSILERCRSEPRILVALLRKEIWKLHDEALVPSQPVTTETPTGRSWTANFHGCPRGILELLHSRSCRSAIMFNDELSREQCQQLIQRLAKCAFPFQCAHGRPSMAPLIDLGVGCHIRSWRGDEARNGGIKIWTRWLDE